jgi:hypothetical protein
MLSKMILQYVVPKAGVHRKSIPPPPPPQLKKFPRSPFEATQIDPYVHNL